MNLKKIKKFVYKKLIDHHEDISRDFQVYLENDGRNGHYPEKLLEIIKLNFKYRICKKERDRSVDKMIMPESQITDLPQKKQLLRKLMRYDVISFDVFDTLIFRAVDSPRDVFRILEAEWNLIGFAKKRVDAEQKAREKNTEVTIENIYRILAKQLSLDMKTAVRKEMEVEKNVCFANPYLKEVLEELQKKKKQVVFVSDMYWPNDNMVSLLQACGYQADRSYVFVSCDYGRGKTNGRLQQIVKKKFGNAVRYIHIGDRKASDIYGSRQAGWDTFYYPNVHMVGNPYRRTEMRTLASAFYKGLVNTKIHSGAFHDNAYYEYGYCYGGVLAVGFCQYLKRLAQQENIGQFLFLARDGYIIKKIYDRYFGEIDNEYIPFSRFASYQLTMERTWEEMLQHVVLPKAKESNKKTVKEILRICDLPFAEKYMVQAGISLEQTFDMSVYEKLHDIFVRHMEEIKEHYQSTVRAAQKYFAQKVKTNTKVCIVDVGWRGTGILCLKYFLEEKCGMQVQVCGALMGMLKSESAEISLANRSIFSYLFSAHHNEKTYLRHMGKSADISYRNMLVEILFTENRPTFLKFRMDQEENVVLEYGMQEHNRSILDSLQKGMLDFAKDYIKYWKRFGDILEICGQEAYIPIDCVAKAKKECMKLFGAYEIREDPGIFEEKDRCTYKELI